MTVWTDAMDAVLLAGWRVGLSEPQIAQQIATKFGLPYSRHSIASRRRRLDLPARGAQVRSETLALSNQARGKKFLAPPAPPPPKESADVKAFAPLPNTKPRPWETRRFGECAWPVGGQGADTLSCCAACEDGQTYCPRHLTKRRQG